MQSQSVQGDAQFRIDASRGSFTGERRPPSNDLGIGGGGREW